MSDLREQLLAIRDEHGRLTAQVVVDSARPKGHPLHSRFEWSDKVAGEAYRREQAKELIRSVRIKYAPADDSAMRDVRAFHAVSRPISGHVYEPVEEVIEDPLLRAMVLRDMERDWKALRQRYSNFQEFWSLVQGDLAETG